MFHESCDGFSSSKFHNVTIIKVKDSDEFLEDIIRSHRNLMVVLALLKIVLYSFLRVMKILNK
jgi:hypothetical protein